MRKDLQDVPRTESARSDPQAPVSGARHARRAALEPHVRICYGRERDEHEQTDDGSDHRCSEYDATKSRL